jgi:hypothetical protein
MIVPDRLSSSRVRRNPIDQKSVFYQDQQEQVGKPQLFFMLAMQPELDKDCVRAADKRFVRTKQMQ